MDKKNSLIITIVAVLVAIGGLGFGISANSAKNEAIADRDRLKKILDETPEPDTVTRTRTSISTYTAGSEEVAKLQEQLAEAQNELATLRQNPRTAARAGRRGADTGGMNMPAMPEGMDMAAMEEQRQARMEEMQARQAASLEALANWSVVNGMTPEEQANHDTLVEMLSAMQNPNETQDRQAMFENMRNMRELMENERNAVMRQFEGMPDEEVAAAMDEMGQIMGGLMGGMGGMGGRGARGGGFGGR